MFLTVGMCEQAVAAFTKVSSTVVSFFFLSGVNSQETSTQKSDFSNEFERTLFHLSNSVQSKLN